MDEDDPIGRARSALGAQLAALRKAVGLSQHELAGRIDGYGRSTVANVERGRQNVAADFWRRTDVVLSTGGSLARGHERLRDLVREDRVEAARSAGDNYDAVLGVGGARGGLPWSGLADGAARPADVGSAGGMSGAFRAADRQVGGLHLYANVIRYLRSDIGPAIVAARRGQAAEMLRAAASFEGMAGWMALDAGRRDLATAHLRHALRLANAAEDGPLQADILAGMSHVALRLGNAPEACRLALAGLDRPDVAGSRRLRARLIALEARGLGCLGDRPAARRQLGLACDLLKEPEPSESRWLGHFDVGSMAAEAAACLTDVGDIRAAMRHAEEALRLRGGDRARSRSLTLLSMSMLHVLDRDLEAACARGLDALNASRTVSSALVAAEFARLRSALEPHRRAAAVRTLLTRMDPPRRRSPAAR